MKTVVPDYYKDFKCIADKCRHNCCIGWEIDIDPDTLAFYKSLNDDFGKGIMSHVNMDFPPHFRLADGDRCPNLRRDGLCEIICRLGECGICEICREHPRFRYSFKSREEVGLGLCCEEAARLILTREEKVTFVNLEDGEETLTKDEKEFFNLRERIFAIIQNREHDVNGRITHLKDFLGCSLPYTDTVQWCDFFLSLERLDETWTEMLEKLKTSDISDIEKCMCTLPGESAEQLLVYFIYRHLSPASDEGDVNERILLALLSFHMIRAVYAVTGEGAFDHLCDVARTYSSEVEYSEENLDEVLFELAF